MIDIRTIDALIQTAENLAEHDPDKYAQLIDKQYLCAKAAVEALEELHALKENALIPRSLPPGDFANFGAIIIAGADPYRVWQAVVALGERQLNISSPPAVSVGQEKER